MNPKETNVKTHRTLLLTAVLGIALAGWTYAQSAPACPECPMQPGMTAGPAAPGGLDLTTDQLDKMDQLRIGHVKEVKPLEADLEVKEMELQALWRADKLDSKRIIAKVKEIAGVRTQLELSRVNQQLGVYNLLTPEQRQKAGRFLGRMMGGMGRGQGRMMGRGKMRGMGRGMGRMGRGMGRMGMMGKMPGPDQDSPCPNCQQQPD
jgi:Spy/CpxP family protein refolding chaperone